MKYSFCRLCIDRCVHILRSVRKAGFDKQAENYRNKKTIPVFVNVPHPSLHSPTSSMAMSQSAALLGPTVLESDG